MCGYMYKYVILHYPAGLMIWLVHNLVFVSYTLFEHWWVKMHARIHKTIINLWLAKSCNFAYISYMQQNVDYVEKFPYLGSYMSSDGDSESDVRARIGKAASIFQRLRPIWSSTTINLNVKLRLYTNIVIPTAIYMRVRRGREQPWSLTG